MPWPLALSGGPRKLVAGFIVLGALLAVGAATSATQYIRIAKSADLQQSVAQLNQDYTKLGHALGS